LIHEELSLILVDEPQNRKMLLNLSNHSAKSRWIKHLRLLRSIDLSQHCIGFSTRLAGVTAKD